MRSLWSLIASCDLSAKLGVHTDLPFDVFGALPLDTTCLPFEKPCGGVNSLGPTWSSGGFSSSGEVALRFTPNGLVDFREVLPDVPDVICGLDVNTS